MKLVRTKTLAAIGGAALLFSLAACGGDEGEVDVEVAESCDFEEGTTMLELCEAGEITIGTKQDQPGLGFLEPGADAPTGFDVEIARILAGALGIDDDGITWEETPSEVRETVLQEGAVDMVVATYSITEERQQLVGQAGPYYVTGQQLLVAEEDAETITGPEDAANLKVCSVTGSTSLDTMVDEYDSQPVPFDTYSECVDQLLDGSVDAVTTDGAILLGYEAENPDELQVVGEPFSEERYGVGYQKGDTEFCQFITDTLQEAMDDGTWAEAFEATLGESGIETPEPPTMDECL